MAQFLVLIFITLYSMGGLSQSSPGLCHSLVTLSDLVSCMRSNNPEYWHVQLMKDEASLVVQEAKQFKNPVFSLRSVGGDNYGMGIGSSELMITYPFPLSARRGSAVDAAKANGEQLLARSQLLEISTEAQFIRDLFRMRQLREELQWSARLHEQLTEQKRTYLRRMVREPEQDVFLNLLQLFSADNLTRQNLWDIEMRELRNRLQRALGPQTNLASVVWPLPKKNWPALANPKGGVVLKRPELLESQARAREAKAIWGLARAQTWPEFNFGPVVQRSNEGPAEYYAYGIQITFELPLLSLNLGARALRAKQYAHAAHEVELVEQQQSYLVETYLQQYQKTIEAQKLLPAVDEVLRQSKLAQGYFQRGLIGGPALIESYRQTMESIVNRHRLESLTLEAFLWLQTTMQKDPLAELERVP